MEPDFAYLIGAFAGDGSFYDDGYGTRFEFVDGSSVPEELHYSQQYIEHIGAICSQYGVNPHIKKKGNKYVLQFRSKELDKKFRELGFRPGPRHSRLTSPK